MSTIHVAQAGEGPTVLCLHGIGSSSEAFAPQFAELADDFRLLAWDAPGYGRSSDPREPLDLDGFADRAAQVIMDHSEGPVHVLGVSWGGVIALRLSRRHPELVRSLILAGSSRGSGVKPHQAAAMRERPQALAREGINAFAAQRGPRLVSADADAALVGQVVESMRRAVRLPGYAYAAESMAATNLTDELPTVTAPTLVLCGSEDEVTGIPESQALAGGIPDAVFVTVRHAGHQVNQEAPASFNAWTSAFISIIERLYR